MALRLDSLPPSYRLRGDSAPITGEKSAKRFPKCYFVEVPSIKREQVFYRSGNRVEEAFEHFGVVGGTANLIERNAFTFIGGVLISVP
jgi:hypothetical protein